MMVEINRRKTKSDIWGKVIGLAVVGLLMFFVCGHLSAVIQQEAEVRVWSAMLLEHIQTRPFDFFHKNGYVVYFAVCIYTLIWFITFSKRELPKAEMKGIEHGSNDFQTEDERMQFLADHTSPVYSLDLHEFDTQKSKEEIGHGRKGIWQTFKK